MLVELLFFFFFFLRTEALCWIMRFSINIWRSHICFWTCMGFQYVGEFVVDAFWADSIYILFFSTEALCYDKHFSVNIWRSKSRFWTFTSFQYVGEFIGDAFWADSFFFNRSSLLRHALQHQRLTDITTFYEYGMCSIRGWVSVNALEALFEIILLFLF